MDRVEVVRLSAAGYLEAAIVMQRSRDPVLANVLDDFLTEFSIQIEPVTADQARLARQAFQLFGKGVHRAGLNFGDCFTYALAKTMREPVLFKGNGFSKTDLIPAWTPDRSS
jgi:ribonuclease VapC